MGWPDDDFRIKALGTAPGLWGKKIGRIGMLGTGEPVHWSQESEQLVIQRPPRRPCDHAVVFKVESA
jgi:hypothetical protein